MSKESFYCTKAKRDIMFEDVLNTYDPKYPITHDLVKDLVKAGVELDLVIFHCDGVPVVYHIWGLDTEHTYGFRMEFTKESHYIGLRIIDYDESLDKDLKEELRNAKTDEYTRVYLTTNEDTGIENRLWDYINKHSEYDETTANNVAVALGYTKEDIQEVACERANPVYYIVDKTTKAINYIGGVADFRPFMYTWFMDEFLHKLWMNTPEEPEKVSDIKARILNDDYSIQQHITF